MPRSERSQTYTFNDVAANHTIAASFAPCNPDFTITATAGPNGAINPSGLVTVPSGTNRNFTITPNAGFHVAECSGGQCLSRSRRNLYVLKCRANHTIAASFAANVIPTFTITATAGPNGAITPSGAVIVTSGADQNFTITPNPGFHIATVLVDNASVGAVASYTFNDVAANHTIAASFAVNTYTINATAGPNGTINPSGSVTVQSGATRNFTITPNAGFHVANVLVDNASVGAVSELYVLKCGGKSHDSRELCR